MLCIWGGKKKKRKEKKKKGMKESINKCKIFKLFHQMDIEYKSIKPLMMWSLLHVGSHHQICATVQAKDRQGLPTDMRILHVIKTQKKKKEKELTL